MNSFKYWLLRHILKYSAPFIKIFEAGRIKEYGSEDPGFHPVFIIGLPRSGSTFLYQLITDMLDVLYVDNLMNLGREVLYFSTWLSRKKFGDAAHFSYTSSYGNTYHDGLHAPAEAGALWYRWIPKHLIYVDENSMSPKKKNQMVSNLRAIMNRYKKPLIIKNLHFATRIQLIRSLFPAAKFIYIRRSPVYTAQSIYLSRIENVRQPLTQWWSVKFPGYESFLGKPLEEQVARQVFELERIIQNDLSDVNPAKVLSIQYESIAPQDLGSTVSAFINSGKRIKFDPDRVTFKTGNAKKLEDKVFDRLQRELDQLYLPS